MEALRSRIGRELHDDLGQRIAMLTLRVFELQSLTPPDNKALLKGLEELATGVEELAATTNRLSHDLHPGKLQLIGLERTIEALCKEVSTQYGLEIDFRVHAGPQQLPTDIELCILRLTQEALSNVVKHSGSPRAIVSLEWSTDRAKLLVVDQGNGIELGHDEFKGGLGLLTMRERVELLDGEFVIHSGSTGTQVEATVPLRPRALNRTP